MKKGARETFWFDQVCKEIYNQVNNDVRIESGVVSSIFEQHEDPLG